MDRKEFVQKLIVRGSLSVIVPTVLIQACEKQPLNDSMPSGSSDNTIDLQDPMYSDLLSPGGYVLLSGNIIVINTGNDEYVALSSKCTHQGCTVGYNMASDTLPCPCHGSVFNIDGSVLNGPAAAPLRSYSTSLDADTLTIMT